MKLFLVFLSLFLTSLSAYSYQNSLGLEYGLSTDQSEWGHQYVQVAYQGTFKDGDYVSPYYILGFGQTWFTHESRAKAAYLFGELGLSIHNDFIRFETGAGVAFLATYIPIRVLFQLGDVLIGPVVNMSSVFGSNVYWTAGGTIRYAF